MEMTATATGGRGHRDDRWTERVWHRVRSEFMELPGMSLKVDQAARLFGIESGDARVILEGLVRAGFLRRTGIGDYARNDSRP